MTNSEKVKLMSGTVEDKRKLFDHFFARLTNGETLDEGDLVMMEFLKKEMFPVASETKVISMSATLAGVGGARI